MERVEADHLRNAMKNFSSVTIGDINIDYVVDISDISFSQDLSGCFMRPIYSFIGGNGVFFAEAAKLVGFTPSFLLASVGEDKSTKYSPDLAARAAVESLRKSGVTPILTFDPDRSTGRVIILYQPDDQRILIADRGANIGFTIGRIEPAINLFEEYKINLLYVSGYCLLDEGERKAVEYIMQYARNKGTFIVVDMVPHDIFNQITLTTFQQWTSNAHAILAEASTLLGFLNIRKLQRIITSEIKSLLIGQLLSIYEFCLIRLNDQSDFIIADHYLQQEVYIPYHSRMASLRFTDRVLASALFYYLSNDRTIPDNEWVISAIRATSKYATID